MFTLEDSLKFKNSFSSNGTRMPFWIFVPAINEIWGDSTCADEAVLRSFENQIPFEAFLDSWFSKCFERDGLNDAGFNSLVSSRRLLPCPDGWKRSKQNSWKKYHVLEIRKLLN